MQAVSLTAQWTAAIRALETERETGRLFEDSLARDLAKPDGFTLLQRYRGAGVQEFVAIRTRFFDDAISGILSRQSAIRQVVMVAAGMDTSAFRLPWPDGVVIYEVDHEPLLVEKAARLAAMGAAARCPRVEVAADLAGNWIKPLTEAGFQPAAPTLWLVEGLMFFLTSEQAGALLSTLRQFSAGGSWLTIDMTSESLLKSPATQLFLATLRNDGVAWRFGTDEPEVLLSKHGWRADDVKEPGQPGAGQGRWPYAPQPREVKGVARSWLIAAEAR